jgi:predicted carbohydrate-binding protein with CBM5 and CBM33 domain
VNRLRMLVLGMLLGVLAALALPPAVASAHGALTTPASRAAACGPLGGKAASTPACKAARAISSLTAWDDLRVPNVNGRDRSVIPDGKLCSGGLPAFAGLDLARADWPATTVRAGAPIVFKYKTTIQHQGTFKLFVTNQGYQPTKPLRWSDLGAKPFLTVTDPAVTDGAYVLRGKLPTGRTGRQIIYAIWQTSSTPDTYYSCADVVFPGASTASTAKNAVPAGGTAAPVPGASPSASTPSAPASSAPAAAYGGSGDGGRNTAAGGGAPEEAVDHVNPSIAAVQIPDPRRPWALIGGVAAALAIIGGLGMVALYYKPRPRHRA